MRRDIKSVFVVTLVYEVEKEVLFMGKSPEDVHRRPTGILIIPSFKVI